MASILVIDDDQQVRDIVADSLRIDGHKVVEATNGADGLTQFRASPADLVITDMAMPKMDGVQLIETLLKDNPSLPIIATSGAPDSAQYLYLASYLGAGRLLTKPFTVGDLRIAVEAALKPES